MTDIRPGYADPDTVRKEFAAIQERVRDWTDRFSAEQFLWAPDARRWSMGQCLEHLNKTASPLPPHMDAAIVKARDAGLTGSPPFKLKWRDRLFVRSVSPGARMKIPAPPLFRPGRGDDLDQSKIIQDFIALQDRLIERLDSAEGLDHSGIMVRSPLSPLLRLSLAGWFMATIAHQQRHLNQAQQVSQEDGFPD